MSDTYTATFRTEELVSNCAQVIDSRDCTTSNLAPGNTSVPSSVGRGAQSGICVVKYRPTREHERHVRLRIKQLLGY